VVVRARLFLVALALVTVSLSTLSRTAAAKTVSPGTYVSRLCTVVDDWAHNIEAARQNADAALAGVTSLDAAKKVLMTAEQRLLADTDQAVKALQRAGAPRVPNGKKVASRGLAGMTLVRQAFERQVIEAATVPTDDVTAFQTAVQNISSNADPAITKFTELFNSVGRLDTSGKLSREVTHQRACIALSNGSATTTTWHRRSPYLSFDVRRNPAALPSAPGRVTAPERGIVRGLRKSREQEGKAHERRRT
jgi:hypothetical protein